MRCARQSRFVATSAGWDRAARVHSVTLALIQTLSTCPEEKHERAYSLPMLSKDERAYSLTDAITRAFHTIRINAKVTKCALAVRLRLSTT